MDEQISVIVPVYNVEKYLPECLDSILGQDYPHLEVILIDDGSTDHSGAICDEYAAKDGRVKVIHQANAGAAAAKNAGLRVATGYYLSFVDSDDFLEPGAYSYMVALLQAHNADAVQCGYQDLLPSKTIEHSPTKDSLSMTGESYALLDTKDWTGSLLWDKLYHRGLFDGIFFEEGHKIDDEYFTYRGMMNAKKIIRDGRIVYNYRKRRSSVTLAPNTQKQILLDRIDYTSKRRKVVLARYPQLRGDYDRHFLNMMILLSRDKFRTEESHRIIRQKLSEYFREKGHTAPDITLVPALLKIRFGKFSAPSPEEETAKQVDNDYFP